jgi:spoIIIJ-associated protein
MLKDMTTVTLETETQEALTAKAALCLKHILDGAGLNTEVGVGKTDGSDIALDIAGPDSGYLVGPHGQTLDALQYLLTLIINKQRDQRLRIWIDASGYRARRDETLRKFAHSLADEVVSTGQEAITDPLNPLERRIIHTALAERNDVQTYSEGEEPGRYVVIAPKVGE